MSRANVDKIETFKCAADMLTCFLRIFYVDSEFERITPDFRQKTLKLF